MARLDAFFKLMFDSGASDLHITSGQPPILLARPSASAASVPSPIHTVAPPSTISSMFPFGGLPAEFG